MIFSCTIGENEQNRRVDEVLRAVFGFSARQIRLIKAQKGFFLDGKPVYANEQTRLGQKLEAVCENGCDQGLVPQDGPFPVVYEDEDLMVLDKPAPLAVTPTPEKPLDTLANYAAAYAQEEKFIFRPVNRLDKGTSGLMLAAKHALAQKKLMETLHTDAFSRCYLAVAEGLLEQEAGSITLPIGKMEGDPVRRCVREDGKPCQTDFVVQGRFVQTNRTLVALQLRTGRTHQIRVHMAALGHPLVGDSLYGTASAELEGRFALHSAELCFDHPFTGKRMEFTSPMPQALQNLLENS